MKVIKTVIYFALAAGVVGCQTTFTSGSSGSLVSAIPVKSGMIPPPVCRDVCTVVYNKAALCNVIDPPALPTADNLYGFLTGCLCGSAHFFEEAPKCIDCLFRNNVEPSYRTTLLNAYNTCVFRFGSFPCPRSCGPVEDITEQCEAIDLQNQPSTSSSTTSVASEETSAPNNTSTNKRKRQADDYIPCICRDENKKVITQCYDCLNDWDAVRANDILKKIQKCSPTQTTLRYRVTETVSSRTQSTAAGGSGKEVQGNKGVSTNTAPQTGPHLGGITGVLFTLILAFIMVSLC
ncbi:hypothetical protein RUND412_004822 [Rhizina undulata]